MNLTAGPNLLKSKYARLRARLQKALHSGAFVRYAQARKRAILRRLQRYERRLTQWGVAVTAGAALLLPATGLVAQPIPAGAEFHVNTFTTDRQANPSVAMDGDGDFVIAWQSGYQDDINSSAYGIYAQRYNSAGIAQGGEFRVNTYLGSNQINPSVAIDSDGDFVIAWQSSNPEDGSSYGIYAQRYDNAGIAQGGEFQVNTWTTFAQTMPAVAMNSAGDFIVAWSSGLQDGSGYGIYAQRYNNAGIAQGTEFRVNAYTTFSQDAPFIAMDDDGDFVVAWHSGAQDAGTSGVYAQRYNSVGTAQGGEFQVNSFTTGHQNGPSVAMDSDGDFVIAWTSNLQESSDAIYAQRYNSAGIPQGGEFHVNTFTFNTQFQPSVAMDSDGDFVVAWASLNQDGGVYGVYAQAYDNAGNALGGEIPVNTFTTGLQFNSAISMDSDGDFVVAWQSEGQDGNYYGVYAQRYMNLAVPIELTRFEGIALPAANVLEWSTGSERDNAGFELQRSADAAGFEKIGFIPGNGTTAVLHDYRFTDGSPIPGMNYYRLKQVDFDGNFEYSDIVGVYADGNEASAGIYPNPAKDRLYIRHAAGKAVLYNVLGQPVKQFTIDRDLFLLDVSDLEAGQYWLEMTAADGSVATKRFIK